MGRPETNLNKLGTNLQRAVLRSSEANPILRLKRIMKSTYDNDDGGRAFEEEAIPSCGVETNSQEPSPNLQKDTAVCRSAALGLAVLMVALSGCAHQYTMKLSNGMTVTTSNRPKLKGANYYYKGPRGEVEAVPQSRVLEIEPTSMAKDENKFKVSQPKKQHWYWPV